MASEQDESVTLPSEIEALLADYTADIERGRTEVLARAVESYQLQTQDGERDENAADWFHERDTEVTADDRERDTEVTADDRERDTEATADDREHGTEDGDTTVDADRDLDDTVERKTEHTDHTVDNTGGASDDMDDELIDRLSELESRLDSLEDVSVDDRLAALESELDEHVEDLRGRIVDVVKEARTRAPANHQHTDLEKSLRALQSDLESHSERLSAHDSKVDAITNEVETTAESIEALESKTDTIESELEATTETIDTLETKADRLAGAVVDLRQRLGRVESHISYETALAELLETAAREDIQKAKCEDCGQRVRLSLLAEPACPHCRSVFERLNTDSGFLSSASLVVADRPALEAGETTDKPFDGEGTTQSKQNREIQ